MCVCVFIFYICIYIYITKHFNYIYIYIYIFTCVVLHLDSRLNLNIHINNKYTWHFKLEFVLGFSVKALNGVICLWLQHKITFYFFKQILDWSYIFNFPQFTSRGQCYPVYKTKPFQHAAFFQSDICMLFQASGPCQGEICIYGNVYKYSNSITDIFFVYFKCT